MKPLIPISAIEAEPAPSIDPELRKRDRLRLIQSELRPITGTPIKDEADRLRRMALWRELDALVRARNATRVRSPMTTISVMKTGNVLPTGGATTTP
jgi:hypothetical protein